ncbi:phosphotransferase [Chloroflexi bacterium TSY]|nr:phosphotransferase [Chloroflexi bacterium TSY]
MYQFNCAYIMNRNPIDDLLHNLRHSLPIHQPETLTVRRAPGIRLNTPEILLLQSAFANAESIFVEREFRSGYSGALVLLVSVDSGQAPIVVKLAHPHDLAREYVAYHRYVEKSAPQNTARLQGEPLVAEDGQLGVLLYTFAGGDPHLPTSSLEDYVRSQGAEATVAVLNRMFRVYGRHWWAINRPEKFVLGEHYDLLLPVHLECTPAADEAVPSMTLTAGEASVVDVRSIQQGDLIQLQNFQVVKLKQDTVSMTLMSEPPIGEASAPLRVRLLLGDEFLGDKFPSQKLDLKPGERFPNINVLVRTTRLALLSDSAERAVEGYDATSDDFVPTEMAGVTLLHNVRLRNPLRGLDNMLDRVVEARMSTVHGDLNLRNVLIDEQTGFAWLIDFADTRIGPTLYDLQRLEVQVLTKLLPQYDANTAHGYEEIGVGAVATLLLTLHSDPPGPMAPTPLWQEPYSLLVGIRRLARQYLLDDLDWDEYYLGLMVVFVGALKFDELDDRARAFALTAASTAKSLLGVALFAPATASTSLVTQTVASPAMPSEPHQIEIPKPPEPTQAPEISGFVGRDDELVYYAEKLESTRLAVISGMAGVGKTALAATLASWIASANNIFWHSFHEGDGIDVMTRKLAGFLAWHGHEELWSVLESARITGGQPPPTETLLDYLLQLLRALATSGQKYLLCFDDFHFVEEDPALNQLIVRLQSALSEGNLSLLITARRMPEFAQTAAFEPLGGLTLDDARRLLSSRGLHLEQEVIDELHALTAGNAQFLTLAVNILTQAADPVLLLERLSQTNDIERYLLTAVDEGLSGAERSVMGAVSVLLGYPGTRDAVEAVLNAGNVWRTLRLLHERHLLTVTEGEAGREYNQHAIVQGFYYQELGRRQRRVMHQRAGEFYEAEEIDLLRSGIHYERAAAYELAARQATADVWAIINRGQARVLRRLLERFRTDQLPPEQWAEVNIAKGTNYAFLDEREKANESYQRALADLEGLSLSERVVELKARICRGMGELLELENPQEALSWLERGLDE